MERPTWDSGEGEEPGTWEERGAYGCTAERVAVGPRAGTDVGQVEEEVPGGGGVGARVAITPLAYLFSFHFFIVGDQLMTLIFFFFLILHYQLFASSFNLIFQGMF